MNVTEEQPKHLEEQPKHLKERTPKGNRRKTIIWIAAIAVAVAAIGMLVWLFTNHRSQEDANITYIGEIAVIRAYLPEGSASRPGVKRQIKYIVIHETDNFSAGADAERHSEFLLNNADTQELSWHYTVDDHEIYHHLPDDEAAYHASDHLNENGGNLNGIGIELCVNEDSDYEKTLQNAEMLAATLADEYHLSISDIKRHEDFSGKICPARLIAENRWEEFIENVQINLNGLQEKELQRR